MTLFPLPMIDRARYLEMYLSPVNIPFLPSKHGQQTFTLVEYNGAQAELPLRLCPWSLIVPFHLPLALVKRSKPDEVSLSSPGLADLEEHIF